MESYSKGNRIRSLITISFSSLRIPAKNADRNALFTEIRFLGSTSQPPLGPTEGQHLSQQGDGLAGRGGEQIRVVHRLDRLQAQQILFLSPPRGDHRLHRALVESLDVLSTLRASPQTHLAGVPITSKIFIS